jgi:hypothetical protein
MGILRERKVWKKPTEARGTRRLDRLSPEQVANVRAAMKVLAIRFGSVAGVARAMGTTRRTLEHMLGRAGKPSAGLAVHAARLAGVPVEDVLTGAFPKPGACPMCGRCGS